MFTLKVAFILSLMLFVSFTVLTTVLCCIKTSSVPLCLFIGLLTLCWLACTVASAVALLGKNKEFDNL
jgi:hypothetical protein